ncbi:MAG: HD domain-containing protein [Actinobacteria bacterium]|nr:HD domain-containing protein [Actinomycetota bacterium]
MTDTDWAHRTAGDLLVDLDGRWRHTMAVGERARELAWLVDERDHNALISAAYLHDIGYSPTIRDTGFHPIDGASFLRKQGKNRLAGLVAHHSFARIEAELRGLSEQLDQFDDEQSPVSAVLAYCDLTTGEGGARVTLKQRLNAISKRHTNESPVLDSIADLEAQATPLIASVERQIGRLSVNQ